MYIVTLVDFDHSIIDVWPGGFSTADAALPAIYQYTRDLEIEHYHVSNSRTQEYGLVFHIAQVVENRPQ